MNYQPHSTLQNQAEFDVIYEKNSMEERETSNFSKSRLSKASRLPGEALHCRPDSQFSIFLEDKQAGINTGPQPTARQRSKGGTYHAATLSTGPGVGLSLSKMGGSADMQKFRYTEQSINDHNL